jgi:DNA-binding transcriptional ArsR family regulator
LQSGFARIRPAPAATAGDGTPLDEVFGALADPIRRGIVERLAHGPCSVTELGAPYDVSAPAISKHLGVLERCGLIVRWKVGRVHYCRLAAAPLADAAAWIERHRAFWSRQLDALGDYLEREDEVCDPPAKAGRPEQDPPE